MVFEKQALQNNVPSIAIVGAGPVGLAFALLIAEKWPLAQLTVYDARTLEQDVSQDQRVLALSYGSIQLLKRLKVWQSEKVHPIQKVHVSQNQPSLLWQNAQVLITAQEMALPMLGAVILYPDILNGLQSRWLALSKEQPQRLRSCFGHFVKEVRSKGKDWAEVDAGFVDTYDLVVMAEGGVYSEQERKSFVSDYGQRAWVGRVVLEEPLHEVAYERFTRDGPIALLPLGGHEAGMVWCQRVQDDHVLKLTSVQRIAVVNTLFGSVVGKITQMNELKSFELGLNMEKKQVQGRIVKIGNAAQTLHPVGGQGLNLGLRDAYSLVDHLSQTSQIDLALVRMAKGRLLDRWGVAGMTDFFARGFKSGGLLGTELRGAGLSMLGNLLPLKQQLARHLIFGWR